MRIGIFFEEVTIENYKCFKNEKIELNVPNNRERGSGLTVIIGNNGGGKTSILEAIEYPTLNNFFVQNKLNINDFCNYVKPIEIAGNFNIAVKIAGNFIGTSGNEVAEATGIKFTAAPRARKRKDVSFSDSFTVQSLFATEHYSNANHIPFNNDNIKGERIEILFFKNDRAKEVFNTGYRTAFQKITDELNWRFLKSIKTNSNTTENTDVEDIDTSRLEALRKELEVIFSEKKDILQKFFSKLHKTLKAKESQQKDGQMILPISTVPQKKSVKTAAKKKTVAEINYEKHKEYQLCINLLNDIITGNNELQDILQDLIGDDLPKKIKILEYVFEFMKISRSEYYYEYAECLQTLLSEGKNLNPMKKAFEELKEYFPNNKEIENICISPFNLLHPFSNASIVSQAKTSLSQINISDLGSGVQMLAALLILKHIIEAPRTTKENKKSDTNEEGGEINRTNFIYLIDEPELHLHPTAQNKLMDLLLEESRTKQIVISTHSIELISRIFRPAGKTDKDQSQNQNNGGEDTEQQDNAQSQNQNNGNKNRKNNTNVRFHICKRDEDGTIKITQPQLPKSSDYPYSLSRGAIAFYAFDIPTTDFHNELYGYLQSLYEKEREKKTRQYALTEFDEDLKKYYEGNKEVKMIEKTWIRISPQQVTIHTYIRNFIHHPENGQNDPYTDDELKDSIKEMLKIIEKKRSDNEKGEESTRS